MQDDAEGKPFNESHLNSAEYRERLMRKLNCLIAVLEVASAKVRRSLAGPAPDVEKLKRIKKNLQDTLTVCRRARTALEKRGSLPAGVTQELADTVNPDLLDPRQLEELRKARAAAQDSKGVQVEMSSEEEKRKFEDMGKIDSSMIWDCDLDDLARRLQAG